MNLLTLGESWIVANFNMSTNGTFFLAKEKERRLEIGFQNKTVWEYLLSWSTKIIAALHDSSLGKVSRCKQKLAKKNRCRLWQHRECWAIFRPSHHFPTQSHSCLRRLSWDFLGFRAGPWLSVSYNIQTRKNWRSFSLDYPKVQVVENWEGDLPKHFLVGSGWPVGQKCKKDGVKKKYAEFYTEEIEKQYQPVGLNLFVISNILAQSLNHSFNMLIYASCKSFKVNCEGSRQIKVRNCL